MALNGATICFGYFLAPDGCSLVRVLKLVHQLNVNSFLLAFCILPKLLCLSNVAVLSLFISWSTASVEVSDDQTDLFVGHFAGKVLEDGLQLCARVLHSVGNGAVCLWV